MTRQQPTNGLSMFDHFVMLALKAVTNETLLDSSLFSDTTATSNIAM